jgi:hypothetical protein
MPPSTRRAGAGAWTTTPPQARQANLGRLVTSTRNCTGCTSRRSAVSAPISTIAPRQHGQAVLSGSSVCSIRGRCAGSRPRPARRRAAFFRRCSGERCSASASLSASEASASSKANCSRSSGSRSERGPNCMRRSFCSRCCSRSVRSASASRSATRLSRSAAMLSRSASSASHAAAAASRSAQAARSSARSTSGSPGRACVGPPLLRIGMESTPLRSVWESVSRSPHANGRARQTARRTAQPTAARCRR